MQEDGYVQIMERINTKSLPFSYPPSIHQAVAKLHWLQFGEDGVLEIFLDNHMMQTFRACEGKFVEEMINGYQPNGTFWFLSFGTIFHKLIEIYYRDRKKDGFTIQHWAVDTAAKMWLHFKMDQVYKGHPDYEALGGFAGFAAMLGEYAIHYNVENERLRVIGTELYFGKSKEVVLLDNPFEFGWAPFRLYLSGKIDLLLDDGMGICPSDHKTAKSFMGKSPMISYEIQEGMTGYIYATRAILKTRNPNIQAECKKILMNFCQLKAEKNMADRFRRGFLYKTDEQLADYRMRMIATASTIYEMLATGRPATWDTTKCTNYMYKMCPFQPVHRAQSKEVGLVHLNAGFTKKPVWDPENVDEHEKVPGVV